MPTEIVATFNWHSLNPMVREAIADRCTQIISLHRQTVLSHVEIGRLLSEIRAQLGSASCYRQWLQSHEFPYSLRFAYGCEWLYQWATQIEEMQTLHLLDIEAAKLLAEPRAGESARQRALELAAAGDRISYTRAKALIAGNDIDCIVPGKAIVVKDPTSDLFGRTVTIREIDRREGVATVLDERLLVEIPLSELLPEEPAPRPPAPTKSAAPDVRSLASSEVERERIELLEDLLRRFVNVISSGRSPIALVNEAREILE
ncbi:hypothetical protein [Thermoleptolyngbya sp. M55_K2018_002]|uniref:hypothetical protein n=1 Tax=Thermoleptolyngbya sp. M55_K2018_002 TaxID=2747808 RepID=UPI0019F9D0E1|nr:hypothetical protein [Thermoleptolyngbya sp. M55_K2018_002]HIK40402.1 hypothetical protein [Thermoleptolyngbya sp. M55_K2018_002]